MEKKLGIWAGVVFLTCCRHSTHCGAVHRHCRAWVGDELPTESGCVRDGCIVRASSWYEILILFLCVTIVAALAG